MAKIRTRTRSARRKAKRLLERFEDLTDKRIVKLAKRMTREWNSIADNFERYAFKSAIAAKPRASAKPRPQVIRIGERAAVTRKLGLPKLSTRFALLYITWHGQKCVYLRGMRKEWLISSGFVENADFVMAEPRTKKDDNGIKRLIGQPLPMLLASRFKPGMLEFLADKLTRETLKNQK